MEAYCIVLFATLAGISLISIGYSLIYSFAIEGGDELPFTIPATIGVGSFIALFFYSLFSVVKSYIPSSIIMAVITFLFIAFGIVVFRFVTLFMEGSYNVKSKKKVLALVIASLVIGVIGLVLSIISVVNYAKNGYSINSMKSEVFGIIISTLLIASSSIQFVFINKDSKINVLSGLLSVSSISLLMTIGFYSIFTFVLTLVKGIDNFAAFMQTLPNLIVALLGFTCSLFSLIAIAVPKEKISIL